LPLDDGGATDVGSAGAPSRVSAAEARSLAGAALRAFARTDLPQEQWWSGVSGYFSPDAAAIYESTDVAAVPVHSIAEGSARLLPSSTRFRAQVKVGTDAGPYTVTLLRAGDQWLVDRFTPP
jgi:hypothetical protein